MESDQMPETTSDGGWPSGRLRAIEESISGLTDGEKLELISRIALSVRVAPEDPLIAAERAERHRINRVRLMARLADLPAVEHGDGLTNRDHDEILYGMPS